MTRNKYKFGNSGKGLWTRDKSFYFKIFHMFWVIEQIIQGVKAISGKRFKLVFIVLIWTVLKQTISEQKALNLSFNLAP